MVHRPSTVWIVIIGLVCVAVVGRLLFHVLGYATAYSAYEAVRLAKKYVEEGRDARDCFKIRTFIPTYPPLASFQADCIHEYASLTKDPEVCELLLPGEYGLACLSEVGGKLMGTSPCVKADGTTWVTCDGEGSQGYLKIDHPQIQNCTLYERLDVREWCYAESTAYLKDIHQCDNIEMPSMRDKCEEWYAFKQKDPSLCSAVEDERRRKYCEIRIGAWLKYPELRDSFYFGTLVPTDGTEEE